MTFHGLAEAVLKESDIPLSSGAIWDIAAKKGYDKTLSTKGKTPSATLGARLYVLAEDTTSVFLSIGKRPKRFYLKGKEYKNLDAYATDEIPEIPIEKPPMKGKEAYLEKDLHAFQAFFAYWKMDRCFTKTISHHKSPKNEYADWIHPDMVGCVFTNQSWESEVTLLNKALSSPAVRLISFELKRQLNLGNLREYFFQTVSNSSWANESYLVAADIADNVDFMNELSRLSNSFGIGVIQLDIQDPNSSAIILPCRFRETLDWETINKLTMNPDFKQFLKRIQKDLESNEVREELYDKVLTEEQLLDSIKQRGIKNK